MNDEKSIISDHEIKIRVMEQINDKRFKQIEYSIDRIDEKLTRIIWYLLCSIIIPLVMHGLHIF